MADQIGGIQIVVTANCPAVGSQAENAPCLLDPKAGVGECGRSIISNASSNISYQQRQRRAQWRGIGSSCMWNAFRASLIGLFLFVSGCVVVLVGFYSEFASIELAVNFNQTVSLVDPESQKRRVKSSYSYIGPVLIGIGVFVLIGVGVATMEMRDMTAKVFPLTKRPYRKSKLTAEALGTMFQTPTQQIMKEMTANSKRPDRQTSFRTVGTQTFRPRSWPWSRPPRRFMFHGKIICRSCQQLCTPKSQQNAILPPTFVRKRVRRSRCRRKLLRIHSLAANSLAVSCPQLDTVS